MPVGTVGPCSRRATSRGPPGWWAGPRPPPSTTVGPGLGRGITPVGGPASTASRSPSRRQRQTRQRGPRRQASGGIGSRSWPRSRRSGTANGPSSVSAGVTAGRSSAWGMDGVMACAPRRRLGERVFAGMEVRPDSASWSDTREARPPGLWRPGLGDEPIVGGQRRPLRKRPGGLGTSSRVGDGLGVGARTPRRVRDRAGRPSIGGWKEMWGRPLYGSRARPTGMGRGVSTGTF